VFKIAAMDIPTDRSERGPQELTTFINYSLSTNSLRWDLRMLNAIVNNNSNVNYALVYFPKIGKTGHQKVHEAFADASNTMRRSKIPGAEGLFIVRDFPKKQGEDDIMPEIEEWFY